MLAAGVTAGVATSLHSQHHSLLGSELQELRNVTLRRVSMFQYSFELSIVGVREHKFYTVRNPEQRIKVRHSEFILEIDRR